MPSLPCPNHDLHLLDSIEDLHIRGYTLMRTNPTQNALTQAATTFGRAIGARTMGVKKLVSSGSPVSLARHTESLTDKQFMQFFALGCLIPAEVGGATCLYDGRTAAQLLMEQMPGIENVRIKYGTVYRLDEQVHTLISHDPDHGPVLRYRSLTPTNTLVGPLPEGMTESAFYDVVDQALDASLVLAHQWRVGDLVIVNNRSMIHSRKPFSGLREMLRYRFDDPHFPTVMLDA